MRFLDNPEDYQLYFNFIEKFSSAFWRKSCELENLFIVSFALVVVGFGQQFLVPSQPHKLYNVIFQQLARPSSHWRRRWRLRFTSASPAAPTNPQLSTAMCWLLSAHVRCMPKNKYMSVREGKGEGREGGLYLPKGRQSTGPTVLPEPPTYATISKRKLL